MLCCLVLWLAGCCGIRVGEATNPGPSIGSCFDDSDADDWPQDASCHSVEEALWEAPPDQPEAWDYGGDCIEPLQALAPTWMGDSFFNETLLVDWREAEKSAGVSDGAPPKARVIAEAVTMPLDDTITFVASKAFLGQRPGWTFGTDEEGTGYRLDPGPSVEPHGNRVQISLQDAIPATACTASLFADAHPWCVSRPNRKKARRARHLDGSRKKLLSRRRRAIASFPDSSTPDDICQQYWNIRESWWKSKGLWALDTANANSWDSLERTAASNSAADILLAQETKRFSRAGVKSAKAAARRIGWSAHLSQAHATSGTAGSGGCAVLVRSGIGITPPEASLVRQAFRHRIAVAWVDGVVRGGVHCISVYLIHSEGLSSANLAILEELYAVIGQLVGPWIASGDWNLSPAVLASSKWLQMTRGIIFAPTLPTCHGSVYDYFIVSRGLAPSVAGVQRIEDGGTNPHFFARLLVRGDGRRFPIRKLVPAPRVSGSLPFGPAPEAPDYSSTIELAKNPDTLNEAMRSFYVGARTEWSQIAGEQLTFRMHRFKFEPPNRTLARPWTGSSNVSVVWRSLARKAEEVSAVIQHHLHDDPLLCDAARRHVASAASAWKTLCNSQREAVAPEVRRWAASLAEAWARGSARWANSLAHLADTRAKKLETIVASIRASCWRASIGMVCPNGSARPTKLAYRWIQGTAGWSRSPVGNIACNDDVPNEGEEDDDLCAQMDGQHLIPSGSQIDMLQIPLCDEAAVDREAKEWASLWKESAQYDNPIFHNPPALEALMPNAVAIAANSFPIGTGLGVDNIAPRALSRLSHQALVALVALFMAFECKGDWCEVLNLVLIVLLPKSAGGFRPIGLFPTIIRIWMRARYGIARAWQAAHSLPITVGGPGRSAQYAAWQAALAAECAALDHLDHIQSLLDLVKAFETVPHAILARCAIALGFPAALIQLSLAAYRLARALGVDGAYSRLIVATRGITAGAGFATVELELLLYETMHYMHSRWATVLTIKVYVDGITLAACGLPEKVIRIMVQALDYLVDRLENTLGMDVSQAKSKVIAGRPSVAAAVIQRLENGKLTQTRQAKMLGTDSVGGRVRSTLTFRGRVQSFTEKAPRIQALRKAGVNSLQMVRTAGTPAIVYGCDVFGMSDSALYLARTKVAAAAAAPTGGKNIELLLHLLDGPAGTLDPAFEAHAAPLLLWTMAIWEGWFTREQLARAFTQASFKLSKKEGESCWNLVTGPATALLASLARINWTMPSAFEAVDDHGTTWDLVETSPGAMAATSNESVRRWRLLRVGQALPGLIPTCCDVGAPECDSTILVDMSIVMQPYIQGTGVGARERDDWQPGWRHSLLSAAVDGQWTQARKASVASWQISDSKCKLCQLETGTVEHRFHCIKTIPEGGWPPPPDKANLTLRRLSAIRQRHLKHHGMLVLRLPAPPISSAGSFEWLRRPDEALASGQEVCWHFDGAMLNGKWKPYRTTGFGIVVTGADGQLLAYGRGKPPHWCKTAAAAEAWALSYVLVQAPFMPSIRTDCLSLITTAAAGIQKATEPRRLLARIWVLVGNALDGDIQQLGDSSTLVWVPAHTSPSSIGEVKRSDGTRLTHIDWRANRLADGLAKQAAASDQPPPAVLRLLVSASEAVRHSAKLLARVTHGANNHAVHVTAEDGTGTSKIVRDSVDKPRVKQKPKAVEEPTPPPPPPSKPERQVAAWIPTKAVAQRSTRSASAHHQRAAVLEEEHLQTMVQQIGARLRPASCRPATQRLSELRERILGRFPSQCGSSEPGQATATTPLASQAERSKLMAEAQVRALEVTALASQAGSSKSGRPKDEIAMLPSQVGCPKPGIVHNSTLLRPQAKDSSVERPIEVSPAGAPESSVLASQVGSSKQGQPTSVALLASQAGSSKSGRPRDEIQALPSQVGSSKPGQAALAAALAS